MKFFPTRVIFASIAFAVSLAGSPAIADNLNRVVTIINNTGYTIVRFYGSHTDAQGWQEDILGSNVLPSGRSVNINFDDGTGYCIFDFRAEFDDGDVLEKYGVNVCEIPSFTYQ